MLKSDQPSGPKAPAGLGGKTRQPLSALRAFALGAAALAGLVAAAPDTVRAQNAGFISGGDAAVTTFSGASGPGQTAPGVNPVNQTFINTEGAVLRILNMSALGAAPAGQQVQPVLVHQLLAGHIGQVFGVAFDDGLRAGTAMRAPNVYVTATAAFGLNIVTPDADGDGRPERALTGTPGAQWMAGQFGAALGGGPGSIYKIDGLTGQVSLFADITLGGAANSGPGLGNIAFDPVNRQLLVSDLDTGMIHRVGLDGTVHDHFDHGVTGRAVAGLEPVAFDPANRLDITDASFNANDASTWAFANAERRIWGVGVHDGRLYYHVAGQNQVWSVGLNAAGFANDARFELDVGSGDGGETLPVSDITFDANGVIYLAQRGGMQSPYNFTSFAEPGKAKVLRFQRMADGTWQPVAQEYAIGFAGNHQNANGGIALGNGYDANGARDPGACGQMLWSTGEQLRNDPAQAAQLQAGGQLAVDGLQGNLTSLVRPANTPPWNAYFVDVDGAYANVTVSGHMGDIDIFKTPCTGAPQTGVPGQVPFVPPVDPGVPQVDPGDPGDPGGNPGGDPGFCPPGTFWNPLTQTCIGIKIPPICPPGSFWNPITQSCIGIKFPPLCPPGKVWSPVLKKCVGIVLPPICPPGKVWSPALKKCIGIVFPPKCPPGKVWNPVLKKCVGIVFPPKCPPGKVWNPVLKKCVGIVIPPICPPGKVWSPALKKCIGIVFPPKCPPGKVWNPVLKKCIGIVLPPKCPPGKVWNPVTKKCVWKIFPPKCPKGQIWNPALKKCIKVIIDCKPGFIWNWDKKKCVPICKAGTKWSTKLNKCVPIFVNPGKLCKPGYKWSKKLKKCLPVFVNPGKLCKPGYKWSKKLKKCLPVFVNPGKLCKPGYKWSKKHKKCLPVLVNPRPICKAGYKWSKKLKKCLPVFVPPKPCKPGQFWSKKKKTCVSLQIPPKLKPLPKPGAGKIRPIRPKLDRTRLLRPQLKKVQPRAPRTLRKVRPRTRTLKPAAKLRKLQLKRATAVR